MKIQQINHLTLFKFTDELGDVFRCILAILIADIATTSQRREILDWYNLKKNLHKVGGSNKRLRDVETSLWRGKIDATIAAFAD